MNIFQRCVILLGTALVLAIGLYPPWSLRWHQPKVNAPATLLTRSIGHHFLFPSPLPSGVQFSQSFFGNKDEMVLDDAAVLRITETYVDIPKIAVEWTTVILVTIGLALVLGNRKQIEGQ